MTRHPRPSIWILRIALVTVLTATPTVLGAAEDPGEALRDAARRGDTAAVRELLARDVDPNAANDYGATALSYAAGKGYVEIARLLIEHGADVDVSDSFYHLTPLGSAAYEGHPEMVALLLENGAQGAEEIMPMVIGSGSAELAAAVIDNTELTPAALTRMLSRAKRAEGAEAIVALLEEAGAKPPPPSDFQLPEEALERYAGTYLISGGSYAATLEISDGALVVHFPPNAPIPLEPVSATDFRPQGGTDFSVVFSAEGEAITGFRYDRPGQTLDFVRPPAEAAEKTRTAETETAEAGEDAETETGEEKETEAETEPRATTYSGAADHNWPAFRGPNAAGTAQGSPPLEWDASTGKNVLFKTPIPGRAHSSPIVWGERIYLTTAVSSEPQGEFRNGLYGDVDSAGNTAPHTWRLIALDRASGEVVWERVAHQGKPRSDNHIKSTQANSTPVTDGERVVAMLGSEGLYAYSKDGELLWKRDLGRLDVGWFYDPTYQWGHASSPVIYEDTVIVQVDRHGDPFIAAYALEDGREVWRTARENLPSWGTPTLLTAGEKPELVTNGARFIRAYDPENGEELWHLGPNSEVTVGTPVVGHGLVFITGGYPPIRPIYAVRPGGRGDVSPGDASPGDASPSEEGESEHLAWWTDTGGTYMPTPLVYGEHLYTLANNGVLTCYRAVDGERLYRARVAGRGGVAFSASPVAAAGRLYMASEDGEVFVVEAGPEFKLLATNELAEVTMATPAIADDEIFIRTLDHLWALGENEKSAGASAEASPLVE